MCAVTGAVTPVSSAGVAVIAVDGSILTAVYAGVGGAGIVIVADDSIINAITAHAVIRGAAIVVIANYRCELTQVIHAFVGSTGVAVIAGSARNTAPQNGSMQATASVADVICTGVVVVAGVYGYRQCFRVCRIGITARTAATIHRAVVGGGGGRHVYVFTG